MQNQERNKKLLIIFTALCLFGTSYFYYDYKRKTSVNKQVMAKKPKTVKPEAKSAKKVSGEKEVQKPRTAKKPEQPKKTTAPRKAPEIKPLEVKKTKEFKQRITPTKRSDIIRTASNFAGKNDPFSYVESNFSPFGNTGKVKKAGRSGSGLPNPPVVEQKPENYVEIKGFLGNKVIAEINGLTDSLGIGDTLRGVKVLGIDSQNFICEFEIKGEKVTRKMKPVTRPDKNVDIRYIKQS